MVTIGVVILITPALKARAKARRERMRGGRTAVIERLDDHRNKKG